MILRFFAAPGINDHEDRFFDDPRRNEPTFTVVVPLVLLFEAGSIENARRKLKIETALAKIAQALAFVPFESRRRHPPATIRETRRPENSGRRLVRSIKMQPLPACW